MNLSDQYDRFLEEWKKEDELEEVAKVIRMINQKINYVEKEKTNELRKYLYNTDSFDYDIFRKFYLDKYKTYNLVDCEYFDKDDEFEFINVEDKKFKTLLIQTYKSMTELRKICNILNNYHKKTYTIISKLIQIDYSDISDYNILKKIMTCLFFKRGNNRLVYSLYKKIKDIFHKKEAKLKKINEEHNLFDIELNYLIYKYCTDDKKLICLESDFSSVSMPLICRSRSTSLINFELDSFIVFLKLSWKGFSIEFKHFSIVSFNIF
jgi:hypothetical protein